MGQTGSEAALSNSSDPEAPSAPRCAASSAQTLGLLAPARADACELAVELGEGRELKLVALAEDATGSSLGHGPAPEACGEQLELCAVEGRVDPELGPLLLLSLRGHASEMPTQVYLGWVAHERLVFVETWYGLPSVVDHTRVGPAWALAPFACAGALELHPLPRLPGAAGLELPENLLALTGRWRTDEDGLPRPPASPTTGTGCRAAFESLP